MSDEKNKENNSKSYIECIPSVILAITAFSFALSIIYNWLYFYILKIDISVIPLTLLDFTLTFQEYSILFILAVFFSICQCGEALWGVHFKKETSSGANEPNLDKPQENKYCQNIKKMLYYDKFIQVLSQFRGFLSKLMSKDLSQSRWFLLIIIIICFFIAAALFYNYGITIESLTLPNVALVLFFPLVALVLCIYMFSKNVSKIISSLIVVTVFIVTVLCFLVPRVQENLVQALTKGDSIVHENKPMFVIRTFEKGFLVRDENYTMGFRYLEGKDFIKFEQSEELTESIKKLVKQNKPQPKVEPLAECLCCQ